MTATTNGSEEAGPAPVTDDARITALDVLRGFALLGILVVNMAEFASPGLILQDIPLSVAERTGAHPALDQVVMTVQWLFFEGKMRMLFSTLFGAGTVLLLERIAARHGESVAADIFHRRNMWLLLFGLLHGSLLFTHDILLFYGAVALLALYPLRRMRGRTLVGAGSAIALVGGTFGVNNAFDLRGAWRSAALQEGAATAVAQGRQPTVEQQAAVAAAATVRRQELAALPARVAEGRRGYLESVGDLARERASFVATIFSSGWVFKFGGLMIAGMGLFKTGFLSGRLRAPTYAGIALAGYAVSLPLILTGLLHARRYGFSDAVTTVWVFLPYCIQECAGMIANAALILLLVRTGVFRPVQRALAALGRTAFSNYILQSLLCLTLFRWGPWKLYGALEYHQQVYVVLAVGFVNVAGSLLWLCWFRYGPLEWLWRSLTYWRIQPMRIGGIGTAGSGR